MSSCCSPRPGSTSASSWQRPTGCARPAGRALCNAHTAPSRSGVEPLLPADLYAAWAEDVRADTEYRHLALLDLVAADAIRRRSHQEALTALEAAMRADPDDTSRPARAAEQLRELGRESSADSLTARRLPPEG